MGKTETLCPHCSTEKITIESNDEGKLKKVKGGKTKPVFVIQRDAHLNHSWLKEDKSAGVVVSCKCKNIFFVEYQSETKKPAVNKDSLTETKAKLYCETCFEGAFTKEIICSKCGNRRVFL